MTSTLYAPPDLYEAYIAYKANCGPAAFAAVLGKPAMYVQRFFPRFPNRPWCNLTQMYDALGAALVPWQKVRGLPKYGLAFIQIKGPWSAPGVPVAAAYKRTHWVGIADSMVYDANADGWLSKAEWDREIGPLLLESNKGSTGFSVRAGIEVTIQ